MAAFQLPFLRYNRTTFLIHEGCSENNQTSIDPAGGLNNPAPPGDLVPGLRGSGAQGVSCTGWRFRPRRAPADSSSRNHDPDVLASHGARHRRCRAGSWLERRTGWRSTDRFSAQRSGRILRDNRQPYQFGEMGGAPLVTGRRVRGMAPQRKDDTGIARH